LALASAPTVPASSVSRASGQIQGWAMKASSPADSPNTTVKILNML